VCRASRGAGRGSFTGVILPVQPGGWARRPLYLETAPALAWRPATRRRRTPRRTLGRVVMRYASDGAADRIPDHRRWPASRSARGRSSPSRTNHGPAEPPKQEEEPFWAHRPAPRPGAGARKMAPVAPRSRFPTPAEQLPIAKMKVPPRLQWSSSTRPNVLRRPRAPAGGQRVTVFVQLAVSGPGKDLRGWWTRAAPREVEGAHRAEKG